MTAAPLTEAACAAALAGLPGIGPVSLRHLLEGSTPAAAWADVRAGRAVRPGPSATAPGAPRGVPWAVAARRADPAGDLDRWSAAGISVTWLGQPDFPARLAEDPEAPAVLFSRGDLGRLGGWCVAVVGTRRATLDGRACAFHLGRDLAAAGVCVVSGLALGIDGAAHTGALDPPADPGAPGSTAAVAAGGVDVPYPTAHRQLWARVAEAGVVLSETAPGRPAQRWRFPSRNRVVAALAHAVVVVESHAAGGSMHTVEAALARGIEVLAVPGPVASPASAGTNQLLRDGATPARDAADVLDALGLLGAAAPKAGRRRRLPEAAARLAPPVASQAAARPAPSLASPSATPASGRAARRDDWAPAPSDVAVLEAVGYRPTSLGRVVERTGLPLGATAAALERLAAAGLVTEAAGWWERCGRP